MVKYYMASFEGCNSTCDFDSCKLVKGKYLEIDYCFSSADGSNKFTFDLNGNMLEYDFNKSDCLGKPDRILWDPASHWNTCMNGYANIMFKVEDANQLLFV